jgi:hypothetical protein
MLKKFWDLWTTEDKKGPEKPTWNPLTLEGKDTPFLRNVGDHSSRHTFISQKT